MTTVLADFKVGLMVADTAASDGDRQWPGARKVWRVRGALLGFAGPYEEIEAFLAWWRDGAQGHGPKFAGGYALVMSSAGLVLFAGSTSPMAVESGRDAIGTGGKGAMCAYDALGWTNPRLAVQIACRYDASSRAPVRSYRL